MNVRPFTPQKFPKTFHAPWSLGITNDDKIHKNMDCFIGKEVVVLEKRDGENANLDKWGTWARSVDSTGGELRTRMRSIYSRIGHQLSDNQRICGENLQYEHSIRYENISAFEVFSIWDGPKRESWDDTVLMCEVLDLVHVPVLWRGIYDENEIRKVERTMDFTKQEGYVITTVSGFDIRDYDKYVAKFVRKGHVQTDEHWKKHLNENGVY
jgi:hypothetical protein